MPEARFAGDDHLPKRRGAGRRSTPTGSPASGAG